jgi:hypothetical protein
MAELVTDCPRCGAKKTTFDIKGSNLKSTRGYADWQDIYETYSVCRHCKTATLFVLVLENFNARNIFATSGLAAFNGSINPYFSVKGYISLKDTTCVAPPDHLPPEIDAAFREGATCLAVKCFNAAGTMFRLCVDFSTQQLLPAEGEAGGPNARQRRDLGLRIQWLFDNKKLPEELRDLAHCIKEDGNDGAHRGTLSEADAEDLLDFTMHLLERRYTLPARIAEAATRRAGRPH